LRRRHATTSASRTTTSWPFPSPFPRTLTSPSAHCTSCAASWAYLGRPAYMPPHLCLLPVSPPPLPTGPRRPPEFRTFTLIPFSSLRPAVIAWRRRRRRRRWRRRRRAGGGGGDGAAAVVTAARGGGDGGCVGGGWPVLAYCPCPICLPSPDHQPAHLRVSHSSFTPSTVCPPPPTARPSTV